MEFITNMEQRYTTKKYDSSNKIDEITIDKLQAILQLSPSSINSQPWKFTFVSGGKVKEQLSEASYFNREKVMDASHIVVFSVIKTPQIFEKEMVKRLPEGSINYYNSMIKQLPDHEINSWMSRQVYLALGIFLSACATMGIDSTPMEGIDTAKYAEILEYSDYQPLVAVAIGKRHSEDANQPDRRPKSRKPLEMVIENR